MRMRVIDWRLAIGLTILAPSTRSGSSINPSTHIRAAFADTSGATLWVNVPDGRMKVRVYRSTQLSAHPVVVLVLHGDSPFAPPSYQYVFAHWAAAALPDAIVAAALRPGYTDGDHDKSDGVRGLTTGDNYTPRVIDDIAAVVTDLRRRYHPARMLIVGHSGGSAIAADLLGRYPSAVDGALLVSCPCDVPRWRAHMFKTQGGDIWQRPVESLSPVSLVLSIARSMRVRMVVGSKDPVAPPSFTEEYARALRSRGISVNVTLAPGLEHNILLEPIVIDQLRTLESDVHADH